MRERRGQKGSERVEKDGRGGDGIHRSSRISMIQSRQSQRIESGRQLLLSLAIVLNRGGIKTR